MTVTTRGTTNGNARGSSYARRARRAWLLANYASNELGFCRCYRCGTLLYNPDDYPVADATPLSAEADLWPDRRPLFSQPLTVDRIIPGCRGGTYRRNNIRPACGPCNSETGGGLWKASK